MVVEHREIAGETHCLVGSDGGVWTLWRGMKRGRRRKDHWLGETWEQLDVIENYDYFLVYLPSGRRAHVHWLVLEAFVGPRPRGMLGLHKNDIKSDNDLENLYWGTPSQNMQDRTRNGHADMNRGSDNGMTILIEEEVIEIRNLYERGNITQKDLADEFCVSLGTVKRIINRKTWRHV
jgi:hypothetical protein